MAAAKDERPALAIGHVSLPVSDVPAATDFFVKQGMRSIHPDEHFAVLELRGRHPSRTARNRGAGGGRHQGAVRPDGGRRESGPRHLCDAWYERVRDRDRAHPFLVHAGRARRLRDHRHLVARLQPTGVARADNLMVDARQVLAAVGLDAAALDAGALVVRSPIDGSLIARLAPDAPEQVGAKIVRAQEAFSRLARGARTEARRAHPPVRRGSCARPRTISVRWSPSRVARSARRAAAKFRR